MIRTQANKRTNAYLSFVSFSVHIFVSLFRIYCIDMMRTHAPPSDFINFFARTLSYASTCDQLPCVNKFKTGKHKQKRADKQTERHEQFSNKEQYNKCRCFFQAMVMFHTRIFVKSKYPFGSNSETVFIWYPMILDHI